MSPDVFTMFELHSQGFTCSQILVAMALKAQGKTNPDLIKAVHGLAGGIGLSGHVCGALSGGACLVSLYAGRGSVEEQADDKLYDMIKTLVEWFEDQYGQMYGGIDCRDIVGDVLDTRSISAKCSGIVTGVYEKAKEILEQEGYTLAGGKTTDEHNR